MYMEFEKWLSIQRNLSFEPNIIISVLEAVSDYAKKHGIIQKSFWEYSNPEAFKKICQDIDSNTIFQLNEPKLSFLFKDIYFYFEQYLRFKNGQVAESSDKVSKKYNYSDLIEKALKELSDRRKWGVSVLAIYEKVGGSPQAVKRILDSAPWAKAIGKMYCYNGESQDPLKVKAVYKKEEKKIDSDSQTSSRTMDTISAEKQKAEERDLLSRMEAVVLEKDMDGMSYDDLKDTMKITMVLTKQLVAQSTKIVDIKGVLIHEEAFIDWEDGADALEAIIEKLMQKNNGYISSTQLFEYARIEMNMFLNDNDMREERTVYEMAQHLFEKVHYHEKVFAFRGKMHISRADAGIGSNLDVYKKYAADQGGAFSLNGLIEYLESIGVGTGNLRNQMRMWTEPIFFFYDYDVIVTAEALHIDEDWKKAIKKSLDVLFDDAGDHMILRNIPSIWFDRLPAISGNRSWTPLLLQSVLRFYNKELGARTIQALDGQSLETLHTMLVAENSPIQNFGDVVISYLLEQNIERRKFEAEELRLMLADGGILHGNELIWNMPKALKQDGRFAWDASGNNVTVKI